MNLLKSIAKRKMTVVFFILAYSFAILTFSIGKSAITSQEMKSKRYSVDNSIIINFQGKSIINIEDIINLLEDSEVSILLNYNYADNNGESILIQTLIKGGNYKEDMKWGRDLEDEEYSKNENIGVASGILGNADKSLKLKYGKHNSKQEIEIKLIGETYQRKGKLQVTNPIFYKLVGNKNLNSNNVGLIIYGEEARVSNVSSIISKYINKIDTSNTFIAQGYTEAEAGYESKALYTSSFLIILITIINSISISSLWVEDRKKEIILRKVLGAKNYNIVILLFGELTVIACISVILALLIQFILSIVLGGYIYNIDIRLHLNNFSYSIVLAIVTAYFSSLPAYRYITKIQPAEGLRGE